MAAVNWSGATTFSWTPILTFTRRRLHLLEWIDEHVDPVAFYEEPLELGIAVLSTDLRLELDRMRMTILHTAPGPPFSEISDLVTGVFEVLEPKHTRLTTNSSVWSYPIEGSGYYEERARFAQRITFPAGDGEYRSTDASALVDLESPDWRGQIEYGVCDASELQTRLANPTMGRLGYHGQQWTPLGDAPDEDELPGVSLLVDTYMTRRQGGIVDGPADVVPAMADAQANAGRVVRSMMKYFDERDDSSEFA